MSNVITKKSSDLRVRSYDFSLDIIRLLKTLPNQKIYWTVSDQLMRSATSISANIKEAQSSASKKDFVNFYTISLKSANETNYWLSLLKDSDLISSAAVLPLIQEVDEICRMLAASLLKLKQ